MNTLRSIHRRAFTLIEAVVVIVALALIVPPSVAWMNRAGQDRVDAVNATRASFLASAVLEQVMADVTSPATGLGFGALASSATYLNTANTGLYARLTGLTSSYASAGLSYTVTIGSLVDQTGAVNGTPALNTFRVVTVTVTFPASHASAAHSLSMSTMVGDL